MDTVVKLWVGGYPLDFAPRTAGRWGCDPCGCGHRPAAGEQLWMSVSYGDIRCTSCKEATEVKEA